MLHEFSRTELLLGKDGMERLKNSRVTVFGIGGVGSHCIEALARSGVGHLTLVDNDTVSVTNINRQSIALHSTVGLHKTKVMKEKLLDINPEISISLHEQFVLPENAEVFFEEKPDFIRFPSSAAWEQGINWIRLPLRSRIFTTQRSALSVVSCGGS